MGPFTATSIEAWLRITLQRIGVNLPSAAHKHRQARAAKKKLVDFAELTSASSPSSSSFLDAIVVVIVVVVVVVAV